jgi:hypothetical protein
VSSTTIDGPETEPVVATSARNLAVLVQRLARRAAALTAPQGNRMSTYDRMFLGYEVTKVFGPLVGVSAQGLRDALVALHRQDPDNAAVMLIDQSAARWRRVAAEDFAFRSHDQVIELGEDVPPTFEGISEHLRHHRLGDIGLIFALRNGFVAVKFAHSVGSGEYMNRLIAALVQAAATGSPPAPPDHRQGRLLLFRASVRHFVRHPENVRRMIAVPRPARGRGHATVPAPAGWCDPLTSRTARSTRLATTRLRAWRDRHAPGASMASTVLAGIWRALVASGLPPDPDGIVIIVDGRRYLARNCPSGPNFVVGQYLSPTAPDDPRSVHHALETAIDAGRPLTSLALLHLRRELGIRTDLPAMIRTAPRPQMTFSYGRLDAFSRLPWAVPEGERLHANVATVSGPESITVAAWEMDGAFHLAASLYSGVFDPDVVAEALRLFCADPVAMLCTPSRSDGQPA